MPYGFWLNLIPRACSWLPHKWQCLNKLARVLLGLFALIRVEAQSIVITVSISNITLAAPLSLNLLKTAFI